MGYGDAYVYCFIISDDVARQVAPIKAELKKIRNELNAIHEDHKEHPDYDVERHNKMEILIDRQSDLYDIVYTVCKYPIACYHVASDDWLDAWYACSKFNLKVVTVKTFLSSVKSKLWSGDSILKNHSEALCICFPSHYDTDDEFLMDMLGVESIKEYNLKRGIEDY